MKIGQLVQNHIGKIQRYCESNPDELPRLVDAIYSKRTFNLNYPFGAAVDAIPSRDHNRYWREHYIFGDKRLRICSQWIREQRGLFCQYLLSRGIIDTLPDAGEPAPTPSKPSNPKGAENSRYGSRAIGNAQNAVIRFILSNLGKERFDETDWIDTKKYFHDGCAYCDSGGIEQMDHGIPINKTDMGEHRLGNLIPSCRKCNAEKHYADFRNFLGDKAERIKTIES